MSELMTWEGAAAFVKYVYDHAQEVHARADGPGGWLFRGKRIAGAVAARLLGELGLDAGSQVLLTGDSAGGVGCLNNADWLYDMLQCALVPCELWGTCRCMGACLASTRAEARWAAHKPMFAYC